MSGSLGQPYNVYMLRRQSEEDSGCGDLWCSLHVKYLTETALCFCNSLIATILEGNLANVNYGERICLWYVCKSVNSVIWYYGGSQQDRQARLRSTYSASEGRRTTLPLISQ